MKCDPLLLVVLAVAVTCNYAQTTRGDRDFTPTTRCGKEAFKCWMDVSNAMQQADAGFDYIKACRQFKLYIACYNNVLNDPLCTNVSEVASINDMALADRAGMCLTDGGVTVCGNLVTSCMSEIIAIKNDYQRKNASAACSLQDKISVCQDKVQAEKSCPGKIKLLIEALISALMEASLLTDCDGVCGVEIGRCMSNFTTILVNGDFINMDWNEFCSDVFIDLDCIGRLKTDGNCSGNPLMASMLDSQNRVLANYCVNRGQPSSNIKLLQQCTNDWKAVGTNVAVELRCQADAAYLECASQISNAIELQPILEGLRLQIDNTETNTHCPIVGSCSERLATCNSLSLDTSSSNSVSPTASCDLDKTALSCFDFVRSDASCSGEKLDKSNFETGLPANMDTSCKDACADRLGYCAYWEQPLQNSASQGSQYCRLAKSATACFNKVRNDTRCLNSTKSTFENSLQSDISTKCAAGELVASMFLVSAVLLQSVLRFL